MLWQEENQVNRNVIVRGRGYKFVERQHISTLRQEGELTDRKVLDFFMTHTDEMLYVVDHDSLIGIISPGDLHRFYASEGKVPYINQKFISINDVNFEQAEVVFQKIKSIHEVPVIIDGKFVGIIVNLNGKKSDAEWDKIRWGCILVSPESMDRRCREIESLLKYVQPEIYVYYMNEEKLIWDEDAWTLYAKKKKKTDDITEFMKMTETEKRDFLKELYSEDYIETLTKCYEKLRVTVKNGIAKIDDINCELYNVHHGYRMLEGGNSYTPRIYFIGPCIVFGAYVSDKHTIEYYLQDILNREHLKGYEIVNRGLMGGNCFGELISEEYSNNDVIIYFGNVIKCWEILSKKYSNIHIGTNWAEAYNRVENPSGNILDGLLHCNHVINEQIANIIFQDIQPIIKDNIALETQRKPPMQNYYISPEIIYYYRYHKWNNQQKFEPRDGDKIGAMVMNCNPFTRGHRYLVEQACLKVNYLYIFVVEEDLSFFSFADRMEMVRNGTDDLANVCVLPSGKYIISKDTFLQYFDKDNINEIEDMSYDVRIFGEVVAQELGIQYRFVGEEPFDIVTREYNETMKHILPEYGIELIEIPRKELNGSAISASMVRKYLDQGDLETVSKLVPQSTLDVCRRYM